MTSITATLSLHRLNSSLNASRECVINLYSYLLAAVEVFGNFMRNLQVTFFAFDIKPLLRSTDWSADLQQIASWGSVPDVAKKYILVSTEI